MKTIILAGGYGTRLSEFTDTIPKPMVDVGGRPIIVHIMQIYARYGFNEFLLALGYKGDHIKNYFSSLVDRTTDFTIDLETGSKTVLSEETLDWKISLIETGIKSMTGGRIKRLQKYVGDQTFMVTYGDGVADVNIKNLVDFHKSHGKTGTICAVRPTARFGELEISSGGRVTKFKEKPQTDQGWINGGFMVFEPNFFDFIDGDDTILEQMPLSRLAQENELMSYKHTGFWQCMDTKRDYDYLNGLCQGTPPWLV